MKAVVAGVAAVFAAGCVTATVAYTSARSDLKELQIALERQEHLTRQAEDRSERYFSEVDEMRERLRDLLAKLKREVRRHDRLGRRFNAFLCFPGRPPGAFYRPPRRVDVTGDGSVDVIRVVGLPGPTGECRYELRVETGDGEHLVEVYRTPDGYSSISPLLLFAELNGGRGQEIFVQTGQGAYATYGKLFTLSNGTVQRIKGMGESQWIFGASTGNGSSFDCPSAGTVLQTTWSYASKGPGHLVTRRTYRVLGPQAALIHRERFVMRKWDEERMEMTNPCFRTPGV